MSDIEVDFSSERPFLHELSNQLIIAQGMTSLVLTAVKKEGILPEKDLLRLEKSLAAVEKIISYVRERRKYILKEIENAETKK